MPLEPVNGRIIREAFRKDVPKIVSIHRDCVLGVNSKFYSPEVIKEWANAVNKQDVLRQFKNTEWVVYEMSGEIVGFAQYSINDRTLFQIQIGPKFQRKGIGTKLYRYVEEKFLKSGLEIVFLNSTFNAVPFYKKLGFKRAGDIKFGLKKHFVEMVRMEKIF